MKAKHRLLNYLINKKIINVENFYAVSISNSSIRLQGKLTSENAEKYSRLFGKGKWDNNNLWLKYSTRNFDITLTI